jgi:hypothetical protein
MVEWYQQVKTPDPSTSAVWQFYLNSHLVANQGELGEGNNEFNGRSIFFHTSKWFLHAVKSNDMGPAALFPSEGRRAVEFCRL